MTTSFNNLHLLQQLPTTLGQATSANSLSVVLASDYTFSVTATNPSVSNTGAAVPTQATMVGANQAGNLVALTLNGSGALKVDGSAVTQPVSGTFWQATQPVSGTVTANAGTGTFAVSAASLPLPTGAATAAKQPALGTAGTASADVLTVQGIASMTALKVDGSAVTQPVSGTITANAGTGTFAVSAVSLPLPTGAATAAKQPALGTAGSPSTDVLTVQGAASMIALKVDGSGVTQPVSGTVTANAGTGTFNTSSAQSGTWNVGTATTTATFQAEGSAAFGSITNAYTTVFTPSAALKILQMRNNTNATISVSLDAGTTTHYVMDSGDAIAIDFVTDTLVSGTSAIQIKYTTSAPTSGSFRVNGVR